MQQHHCSVHKKNGGKDRKVMESSSTCRSRQINLATPVGNVLATALSEMPIKQ